MALGNKRRIQNITSKKLIKQDKLLNKYLKTLNYVRTLYLMISLKQGCMAVQLNDNQPTTTLIFQPVIHKNEY